MSLSLKAHTNHYVWKSFHFRIIVTSINPYSILPILVNTLKGNLTSLPVGRALEMILMVVVNR